MDAAFVAGGLAHSEALEWYGLGLSDGGGCTPIVRDHASEARKARWRALLPPAYPTAEN